VEVRHAMGLAPDLSDDIKQKIIYNSKIHRYSFLQLKRIENKEAKKAKRELLERKVSPLALRFLYQDETKDEPKAQVEEKQLPVQLPYKLHITKPHIIHSSQHLLEENVEEETDHSSIDFNQIICESKS
jgi:hypothetical protein